MQESSDEEDADDPVQDATQDKPTDTTKPTPEKVEELRKARFRRAKLGKVEIHPDIGETFKIFRTFDSQQIMRTSRRVDLDLRAERQWTNPGISTFGST